MDNLKDAYRKYNKNSKHTQQSRHSGPRQAGGICQQEPYKIQWRQMQIIPRNDTGLGPALQKRTWGSWSTVGSNPEQTGLTTELTPFWAGDLLRPLPTWLTLNYSYETLKQRKSSQQLVFYLYSLLGLPRYHHTNKAGRYCLGECFRACW